MILDTTELNVDNIESLIGTDPKYVKRRNRMWVKVSYELNLVIYI